MGRRVEHNPNKQGSWFQVEVFQPQLSRGPTASGKTGDPRSLDHMTKMLAIYQAFELTLSDAKKWCEAHSHGRWTSGVNKVSFRVLPEGGYTHSHIFRFKGRADAMMFKLIYG